METTCFCSAESIRLKFNMWCSCDHRCYLLPFHRPMVWLWMCFGLRILWMPVPTYFIYAATSKPCFIFYITLLLCCSNTMQQSCNRPTSTNNSNIQLISLWPTRNRISQLMKVENYISFRWRQQNIILQSKKLLLVSWFTDWASRAQKDENRKKWKWFGHDFASLSVTKLCFVAFIM